MVEITETCVLEADSDEPCAEPEAGKGEACADPKACRAEPFAELEASKNWALRLGDRQA